MGLFDSIRRVVGGEQSTTDAETAEDDPELVDTHALDETDLRDHAEGVAGEVEQLDFSLSSLEQFDAAIDAGYDESLATADEPGVHAEDVVRFGCYLGAVLIRVYDGEWTRDPDWGVTLSGPDDSVTVAVFDVATRSIQTESVFAAVADRAAVEIGHDGDVGDIAEPGGDSPEVESVEATDDTDAAVADTDGTEEPADDGPAVTEADETEADETEADETEADETEADETGADETGADETGADETEADGTGADETEADGTAAAGSETATDEATPPVDGEPSATEADGTDGEPAFEFGRTDSDDGQSSETSEATDTERDTPFEAATTTGGDEVADDTESGADDPLESGASDDVSSSPADDTDDVSALVEEAEPDAATSTDDRSLLDEADPMSDDPVSDDQNPESDGVSDPTEGDGIRAEYAEEAEGLVSFWNEHDLDYTPESLGRLDALVSEEWDDDRFDDATFGSEESFDDRAFTSVSMELGSYFGEVLVRELDGEWSTETANDSVVIDGPDGPLAIPVFRVAGTSLTQQPVFARSYESLLSDLDGDA